MSAVRGSCTSGERRAPRSRVSREPARILLSLVAGLAFASATARAGDLSPSMPHYRPDFPVFGGGKLVNVFDDDQALTNAAAHVGWAIAVPLAGERIGGRKGLWIAGVSWMALSVVQEALFHAPAQPEAGYPSEVRADLLTRLVPTAALLLWDLLHADGAQASSPGVMPGPMRPGVGVQQRAARADHPPRGDDVGAPGSASPAALSRWLCPDEPAAGRTPVEPTALRSR
jgi:hypothetical protein